MKKSTREQHMAIVYIIFILFFISLLLVSLVVPIKQEKLVVSNITNNSVEYKFKDSCYSVTVYDSRITNINNIELQTEVN